MGFKFERLDAWKKAIEYTDAMFDTADGLPQKYQFSLGEQLRRCPEYRQQYCRRNRSRQS